MFNFSIHNFNFVYILFCSAKLIGNYFNFILTLYERGYDDFEKKSIS